MSQFLPYSLVKRDIALLQQWLELQNNVFEFADDKYSSLLICYILAKEIGTPNDSLSRYVYDTDTKQKIDKRLLNVAIGYLETEANPVVQIVLPEAKRLGITLSYVRELVTCCDNKIIISPGRIATYLRSHGLVPVLVKPWIQQTIFSTFDIRSQLLNDQLWALRNNDIYLYSRLVSQRKVVFQSTHDIVGHIAGTKTDGMAYAADVAARIHAQLKSYFGQVDHGNLPAHLLPFMMGLLLDDLTQPPNYFSEKHTKAIDELLIAMNKFEIDPQDELVLRGFPARINLILQMVREEVDVSIAVLRQEINKLLQECKALTTGLSF